MNMCWDTNLLSTITVKQAHKKSAKKKWGKANCAISFKKLQFKVTTTFLW